MTKILLLSCEEMVKLYTEISLKYTCARLSIMNRLTTDVSTMDNSYITVYEMMQSSIAEQYTESVNLINIM